MNPAPRALAFAVTVALGLTGSSGKGSTEPPAAATARTARTPFVNSLTEEERAWLKVHPVIRVFQDPGWPPIEFADDTGAPSGMTRDYLNLIEQRLGLTFEQVRNLSWQEGYSRLKRGEIDMTTTVMVTPERLEFWSFTRPYMTIPIVIATRPDVTYLATMKDLSGRRVAVVDGYSMTDLLPKEFPDIQLVRVKTSLEGLERLQRGEVFAFIDSLLTIGYHQAQANTVNLKIAGQTPYANAQCMAVRKDWAPLAGILQKALDSISEEERSQILRRWMPLRYEQGVDYRLLGRVLAGVVVLVIGLVAWNRRLAREVRKRREAQAALAGSEERYRLVTQSAFDAIVTADRAGLIVGWNKGAKLMFGYTEAEALGRPVTLLMPERYQKGHLEGMERLMSGGASHVMGKALALDGLRSGGGEFPLDLSIARWEAAEGWFVTAIIRDMTERKQAETALIAAKNAAEELLKIRTTFLDLAAHELRTPVTGLSLLLGVVEKQMNRGQTFSQSTLVRLRQPVQRLLRLVIELLDLARLERGQMVLLSERSDVVLLIEQCLEEFRLLAPTRSFVFARPEAQVEVDMDPIRIAQVLSNLLDNAVKYTGSGGPIEVTVEALPDAIRVSVIDHGPGMTEGERSRLFTAFARGKSDATVRASGLGLGLDLCRRIMSLHGGTVDVRSDVGRGSTFYFDLPRKGRAS